MAGRRPLSAKRKKVRLQAFVSPGCRDYVWHEQQEDETLGETIERLLNQLQQKVQERSDD